MQGVKLPFLRRPKQKYIPIEPSWSTSEKHLLTKSISDLLAAGAITRVKPCKNQYISNIFLRQKSNGTYRLILNLKSLNKHIRVSHFKLEDNKTVASLIQRNCSMATLDLQDAYLLVPIHVAYRKYFRFRFGGKYYQYVGMPFGLNIAPYIFTKIMKPILCYLRSRGYVSVVYLDDFLMIGNSITQCQRNVSDTIKTLESLGFLINRTKSCLIPSTVVTYLGFQYDSTDMSISLPPRKRLKVRKLLKKFSVARSCRIREFARFLGTIVSICPAIKYAWVYTKLFERAKFLALRKAANDYNATMELSSSLSEDFNWWLEKVSTARNVIRMDSYNLEIYSDASKSGWGAVAQGKIRNGFWSVSEKEHHINYLELLAAFHGLQCFARDLSDCNVLLRIDNTTAIAYINKMGSVQHPKLNGLSRAIWQWCEARNLFVYATYIKSSDNKEADAASRILPVETEWSLSNAAFGKIELAFGRFDIDLFASATNAKCQKFVSWLGDHACFSVDAFTLNWEEYYFYAFPPFALIPRVLHKIINDKAEGVVVVPLWTSQPWYPLFCSLLSKEPIVLQPDLSLLSFDRNPHPLWRRLTLVAGRLSFKHYNEGIYPKNH